MLDERSAAGDVQQLESAADREQGNVALERAARQRQFDRVASLVARAGAGVPLRPVLLGRDVVTADEHHPVQHLDHVLGWSIRWGSAGITIGRPPASRVPSM